MKRKLIYTLLLALTCFRLSAQVSQEAIYQLETSFGPQRFFQGHLTGFMLYDLESQQVIFEKNSHQYQIPSSTTKLLTLYGALLVLEDSTQTLRYQSADDTLKIWGSGDPSWRYKDFYQPDFQKIIANHKVIQFSDANQISPSYGYGWQWDDYYFAYAAERSSLPIYGNLVKMEKREISHNFFQRFFKMSFSQAVKFLKKYNGIFIAILFFIIHKLSLAEKNSSPSSLTHH